ncbi:ATP-binding cassette transporter abc4 [Mycena sanguinolenta]|uniref:ATP-binding cassette transporter abc4 n=1 Tax=Mycena sanguinolenta TaxID=230812 RepID=A0A8H6TSE8_9AGAR|nr:ATP-binding cassette transporter abc4 [Mycena sanguinolenta]
MHARLSLNMHTNGLSSPWLESLFIPIYCATLLWTTSDEEECVDPPLSSKIREIPRLCGCVALVGLTFASIKHDDTNFSISVIYQLGLVYVYASVLAFISIIVRRWTKILARHLNILFCITFFTYVYRDLFPLATFTQPQRDISEGWLLWAKFSIVTAIGVVVPLFAPQGALLDKSEALISPEETASLFSLVTYTFLDPLILLASRLPHLPYNLLPPLAYYDDAKNLKSASFPYLDPSSNTNPHHVAANFSNPVAINRLLDYLEMRGSSATIRPWFWICLLFVGPMFGSIATQWSNFIYSRVSIQTEAILTELVFEHSLRVRVKAETSQREYEAPAVHSLEDPTNGRNLVGKLNNLITTDLHNIVSAGGTLPQFLLYFLQSCLGVWFLYEVLDWAAFVGLGVTLAGFPLLGYIGGRIRVVQQGLMQQTDARVQKVSEIMNLLRMIKLFAWEKQTEERISDARERELKWLWRCNVLELTITVANFTIPTLTMLSTYATYSMTVFDMFRRQLYEFFAALTILMTGRTELLDTRSSEALSSPSQASSSHNHDNEKIGFNNATFSWSSNDGLSTSNFLLRIEGQLLFKRDCINLIMGPTGSGKTSLLMALLGEMHFLPSSRDSWFNLPRDSGVAYAAQQSWVQNDTIKGNILFGAPFDLGRYNKGDLQEIGENGVTLSGGQRMRVTLARAVYSSASILLLDDVFAALDVHTAQWIADKCFAGELLAHRTVILVTHNIALTKPIAGFIVSLDSDGLVQSQGAVSEVLAKNHDLTFEVINDAKKLAPQQAIDESPEKPRVNGRLVTAEEINVGHVSWTALKLYLSALGGRHPFVYFTGLILCMFIADSTVNLQTWYLSYFASQYEDHEKSQVHVAYHLSIYAGILFATMMIHSCSFLVYLFGMVRASSIIHTKLIQSIMGTTLRFLDITPTSRVIARCTEDLRDVDLNIGPTLWAILELSFFVAIRLGAIVLLAPPFLLPAAVLLLVGAWIGALYTKAQLSIKREMYARAPILGHFGAAITGLVSIRAYAAQEAFIDISLKHINHYTRSARTFQNLHRWIALRMDTLGAVFTTALATYMVYFRNHSSSSIGFSLNMASAFGMIILGGVSMVNDLEVQSNSLERINDYLQIEQEPKPTFNGLPPAHWPSSGNLQVENLSARYSVDGPAVLHGISFDIKGGERIGIVGRTGSGKSSLTLALLRAIYSDGEVYYDGIPTSSLNLQSLRRNITIIPQTPELLSGSLRMNLDPLGEHDDLTLNTALRAAGLFTLQGGNHQRKRENYARYDILALSRALIRGSKVLILDEATSAIDYETDKIIQESLRTELGKDVTLLTVAHRLQSIMDADRIMVLDAGMIAEFASPRELLANEEGMLRALVDESQDRDILYSMASK